MATILSAPAGFRRQASASGLLGAWLLAAGSLLAVPFGVAASFNPALADPRHRLAFVVTGAGLTLSHFLVLAGIGLLAAGPAAGRGRFKAVASVVAIAALTGQAVAEAALRFDFALGISIFSIDTPALGLGMILFGVAVIRARVWAGWHRYTPLAWGIYIPLVLIPSFIVAKGPSFPVLTVMSLLVVGFGVAALRESGRGLEA
jgi:hypothetical protein